MEGAGGDDAQPRWRGKCTEGGRGERDEGGREDEREGYAGGEEGEGVAAGVSVLVWAVGGEVGLGGERRDVDVQCGCERVPGFVDDLAEEEGEEEEREM